ncbi:MAG: hypothetical protein J6S60_00545 [Oscillospiraceae bacterium]|nr:hypothetical protein [Oscillospiraceae bacterium]
MSRDEFDKIWRMMATLWPNAAAKKTDRDKKVWAKIMGSYKMQDVTDAVMAYSKTNKFFPDVADITKNLLGYEPVDGEAYIIRCTKLLAKIKGIEAPDFQTKDEALEWYRGLEGSA